MSRASDGTYTAPASSVNPAVEGTEIDEVDFNALVDDLESALTDSVARSGKGSVTAHVDFTENASPGTPAANDIRLYASDVSSSTALLAKDSAGNVYNLTMQAPALSFSFDTSTTTSSDPGAGDVRFNNATFASITAIAIDDLDSLGVDVSSEILAWDDLGTSAARGYLVFQKRTASSTVRNTFVLTGSITDSAGWCQLTVTPVASTGNFAAGDAITVQYLPPGPTGTGDMTGPASSTDNALVRFDGTTGKISQNSGVIVDDSNNMSGVAALSTTSMELGHASDTTITRGAAGLIEVEGVRLVTVSATQTLTNKTLTAPAIAGATVTGVVDAGGADSFELPNSAAPTVNADGEIAIDTTVTDFAAGVIKYYSTAEMGVVAMPVAQFGSPVNGAVPTYNSTNDQFEMSVPAGAGDFIGPASSTDNAVVRFDSTTGKLGQNSALIVGDTSNGGAAVSGVNSINTGQLAGFRNVIINGAMQIAQRGTSFTSTGSANNDDTYNLDRWTLLSDGNDIVDITQSTTAPTNGLNSIALDVETVNKKFGIIQFIEQKNCIGLIGNTVTLSFQAKVSSTTKLDNVKAAILSWSSTADSVTSDVVSAWGAEDTNPTLAANWTYENTPANLNVTTSFAQYSVTAAVDTASTTNIAVFIWSDVTDTTLGDFLYITNVQLEIGSQATPFERRPQQTELANCQRYLPAATNSSGSQELICQGYIHASTVAVQIFTFQVAPRIPPTGITVTDAATTFLVAAPTGGGATYAPSAIAFNSASYTASQINWTISGATALDPATFNTLSGGKMFFTGCEL